MTEVDVHDASVLLGDHLSITVFGAVKTPSRFDRR